MVSAANEQQRQPSPDSTAQKLDAESSLKPVKAVDFLPGARADKDIELKLSFTPAPEKPAAHAVHHEHHLLGSGTVEEEQRNSIAFKYVGAPSNNQAQSSRAKVRSTVASPLTPEGLDEEEASLAAKKSSAESKSSAANGLAPSKADRSTDDAQTSGAASSAATGIDVRNETSNGLTQNVEKLLTLVGPDAIVNLKARLREVWVDIDSTAATDLDVLARMPVTTAGLSASELLMVQSPQGVHFVAFLKNRNDFEVLQTFDRHSLLPGNAPKQLMEAAMMAYEQLGAVFEAGAERLEQRVQARTKERNQDQMTEMVTQELRGRWVQSKRRRKKCDDLVEELVERIDEIDFAEKHKVVPAEADAELVEDSDRIIKPENERPVLETGDDE